MIDPLTPLEMGEKTVASHLTNIAEQAQHLLAALDSVVLVGKDEELDEAEAQVAEARDAMIELLITLSLAGYSMPLGGSKTYH